MVTRIVTGAIYLIWLLATPDVRMGQKRQHRVRSPPFRLGPETGGRENGEICYGPAQAAVVDECGQLRDDAFPRLIIGIRQALARLVLGQEGVFCNGKLGQVAGGLTIW